MFLTSDVSSAPIAKVIGGYLSAVLHSMYRRLTSLDDIERKFKNWYQYDDFQVPNGLIFRHHILYVPIDVDPWPRSSIVFSSLVDFLELPRFYNSMFKNNGWKFSSIANTLHLLKSMTLVGSYTKNCWWLIQIASFTIKSWELTKSLTKLLMLLFICGFHSQFKFT